MRCRFRHPKQFSGTVSKAVSWVRARTLLFNLSDHSAFDQVSSGHEVSVVLTPKGADRLPSLGNDRTDLSGKPSTREVELTVSNGIYLF